MDKKIPLYRDSDINWKDPKQLLSPSEAMRFKDFLKRMLESEYFEYSAGRGVVIRALSHGTKDLSYKQMFALKKTLESISNKCSNSECNKELDWDEMVNFNYDGKCENCASIDHRIETLMDRDKD